MGARAVTWLVCALLGLAGSAHAGDQAPAAAPSATPSPSTGSAEQATRDKARSEPASGVTAVDEEMLEYLDVLDELTVLDSLEVIESLQAAGDEEDEP